jgi:hypothetical protein
MVKTLGVGQLRRDLGALPCARVLAAPDQMIVTRANQDGQDASMYNMVCTCCSCLLQQWSAKNPLKFENGHSVQSLIKLN